MIWDDDDIKRFMKSVDKLPNGCWFWMGARSRGQGNKKWYGTFSVKGKSVRAHRFAAVAIGNLPEPAKDEHRGHTCDFSLCVNPDHLEIVHRTINQKQKTERRKRNVEKGS